ncbi:MAG: hypothetical protein SGJ19_07270 [Planctomycetia bacterium]|nr:hypothetical protein [Planctomycetia bacterium]
MDKFAERFSTGYVCGMPNPPTYLYKYRAANERTVAVIERGELYFSFATDFNDPFDCVLRLSMDGPENISFIQSRVYESAKKRFPNRTEDAWRRAALLTTSKYYETLAGSMSAMLEEKLQKTTSERILSRRTAGQHADVVSLRRPTSGCLPEILHFGRSIETIAAGQV